MLTHGLNMPRHGAETARRTSGSYPVRGAGQNRRPQHKASGLVFHNHMMQCDLFGIGKGGS